MVVLTVFFLICLKHRTNNTSISENEIFEDIFKNELKISYNIIYKFMKELNVDLSFDNWKTYCHKYSCIPHV